MAKWSGRSRGSALGYKIFLLMLRKAGVRSAYVLLVFVALYFWMFSWSSGKHIYRLLKIKLGFSSVTAFLGVYRNFFVFGQTLIDRMAVMSGGGKFTYNFEGEEHLLNMSESGSGGLLISAHVGNWEIAGHLLYRIKARIHIVMFDGESEKIKAELEKVKEESSVNFIFVKEDLSHLYAINEALQNKDIVCMHGDRFMPGTRTVEVNLLGDSAQLPSGPLLLASRYQVPVSFVFAMKEKATHYHFFATAPEVFKIDRAPDQAKQQLDVALKKYTTQIEEKLKRYPYQWFNYYDFWNTDGKTKRA
jgi:predicted LPLAT superfamily acyltransferase